MTRLWTIAFFVAGSTALAATPAEGEAIFNASCSQCHTALQPLPTLDGTGKPAPVNKRTPWAGPDLVQVFTSHSNDQLRTWMAGPTRQKKDTSCRIFPMRPDAVDAVFAFLVSASRPPALTAKAAMRKNLKEGLERARSQGLHDARRK